MKLGTETNSFFNHLMSKSITPPKVGAGATRLYWTDRNAYFVNKVSHNGKEVEIERANPVRIDKNGMSESQCYRYERYEDPIRTTIYFKWGCWREKNNDGTYSKVNIIFGVMNEYYDFSY